MSLISLDFRLEASIRCAMISSMQSLDSYSLTSTQIGAIGEAVVAVGLTLASGGRLAPFKPFADDDGIDLLIYDKLTKLALPVQVKSRTKFDNEKAQTVQFDVQRSTYTDQGGSYLFAVVLDGSAMVCSWLVPMSDLRHSARSTKNKLSIVPSAKPTSNDRYTPYRRHSFEDAAAHLIQAFSNQRDA